MVSEGRKKFQPKVQQKVQTKLQAKVQPGMQLKNEGSLQDRDEGKFMVTDNPFAILEDKELDRERDRINDGKVSGLEKIDVGMRDVVCPVFEREMEMRAAKVVDEGEDEVVDEEIIIDEEPGRIECVSIRVGRLVDESVREKPVNGETVREQSVDGRTVGELFVRKQAMRGESVGELPVRKLSVDGDAGDEQAMDRESG